MIMVDFFLFYLISENELIAISPFQHMRGSGSGSGGGNGSGSVGLL